MTVVELPDRRTRDPKQGLDGARGGPLAADGDRARLSLRCFSPCRSSRSSPRRSGTAGRPICTAIMRARRGGGADAHADCRGDRRAGQPALRRCAAWAIGKFQFRGKQLLITLIDSAVCGFAGHLGHGVRAAVRPPGVSRPVAGRSRHPDRLRGAGHRAGDDLRVVSIRRARDHPGDGSDRHRRKKRRRACSARAGFQTFFRVTLPNIKWGLLYGVILCNARAMGEFGAVSVVSGHIRGLTNTLPLHVEILYNEYQFQAAFAVASLLAFLALVTLVLKTSSRRRVGRSDGRIRARLDTSRSIMSIDIRNVSKTFGTFAALRRRQLRGARRASSWRCSGRPAPARRRCCASSPGSRRADAGTVLFDGEDATDAQARRAPRRLRVPALRAVPAHDGVRERRVRPARAADARIGRRTARSRDKVTNLLKLVQLDYLGDRYPVAALRRTAPARRAGARAGRRAEGAAARRAVRRARRKGAAGAAALAAAAARGDSPDERLRHARSGRGARAGRSHRRS